MFKHYFEKIDHVQIFPIISLSIFFLFFLGLLWWVWKADKGYIKKMKSLPVEDENDTFNKTESNDEKSH